MNKLNDLLRINYHDSLLLKLSLSFEEQEIQMVIQQNLDEVPIQLTFSRINLIAMQELKTFQEMEIYSAEYSELDNCCAADFVFLSGPKMPSWNLSFRFQEVVMGKS